ncbi:MAG: hypothetical protein ACK5QQ_08310 [Cyanobacteriota bacterium]
MKQTPRSGRQNPRGTGYLLLAAAGAAWVLSPVGLAAPNPGKSITPAAPAQVARDGWKDCSFNGVTIGCIDNQLPDGLSLLWKDGLKMTYRQLQPAQAGKPVELRDLLGGVWRRQVLSQGNTVLTNEANGARIFVPLRFTCKPPLRGEVGYCHY